MAKIDKSKYTKEELKRLMAERRAEKQAKQSKTFEEDAQEMADAFNEVFFNELELDTHPHNPLVKRQNYVLCLKHGDKYSAEYVNVLYRMVKRNLTIPFTFVCLTDNENGLDKDILPLALPKELSGWWCKPYMYSADLSLGKDSTILYMDRDVVISGNLDKLFEYEPEDWCVIRDFTRSMQPNWEKYNSSVVRFKLGQLDHVWRDFIKDPKKVISSHFGDQDWLWTAAKGTAKLWPDEWIRSWKWEIRKDKTLASGPRGARKLKTIEDVVPAPECCIAVFHGDPNPHNCDDPWVKNNWR